MHRQPLLSLPSLHRADAPAQIRGDLFPGIEPVLGGEARLGLGVASGLPTMKTLRIAQTCAKRRHAADGTSLRLSRDARRLHTERVRVERANLGG